MLAIFSGTAVSFVTGIYAIIIATQGLTSTHAYHMIGAAGISSVFAGLRVLLILVVSQNLMNKVRQLYY